MKKDEFQSMIERYTSQMLDYSKRSTVSPMERLTGWPEDVATAVAAAEQASLGEAVAPQEQRTSARPSAPQETAAQTDGLTPGFHYEPAPTGTISAKAEGPAETAATPPPISATQKGAERAPGGPPAQQTAQQEQVPFLLREQRDTLPTQRGRAAHKQAQSQQARASAGTTPARFPTSNPGEAFATPTVATRISPTGPAEQLTTYEEFLRQNQSNGAIKVQVTTASGTYPVAGAKVVISKDFLEGERQLFEQMTDESGTTQNIALPAPARALSMDEEETETPYASYRIQVTHPDYHSHVFENVPVFADVKSIQPVDLIPAQLQNSR